MGKSTLLNSDRVAFFETAGWRAYYDHAWLKLLRLLVGLCQEQFGIPFPISLLAAYYTVKASVAWVATDHNEEKVLAALTRFYELARRYSGLNYDPRQVAVLETKYWEVHRRLSGKPEKAEFIDTLTALHSATFGIPPERARESAELRVLAANLVDGITSHTSTDPEADWRQIEVYLQQCYRSIKNQLEKPESAMNSQGAFNS